MIYIDANGKKSIIYSDCYPKKNYYRDEYGDIFSEDDLPDDGRDLWEFPGKEDGDQDPIRFNHGHSNIN